MKKGLVAAVAAATVFLPLIGALDAAPLPWRPPPRLIHITVAPSSTTIGVGTAAVQLHAYGHFSDGSTQKLTNEVVWGPANGRIVAVSAGGQVTAQAPGSASAIARLGNIEGQSKITVPQPGYHLVKDAGLYTNIEERGWASGYYDGDLLHNWTDYDRVVGSIVSDEASAQLDAIRAMGVNTVTFELRTTDSVWTGTFVPPSCNVPPSLGLLYPNPAASDLTNLTALLNMLQAKHMKMWLMLIDTHMEQTQRANSQEWLTAILQAVGNHPALDAIFFDGTPHTVESTGSNGKPITVCGIPAEPSLWLGPASTAAVYVQWAINLALSLGVPTLKLSTEAIVGDFVTNSEFPAGAGATDGHLWPPILVEKDIYDAVGIPDSERTYGLSFYEHDKCVDAGNNPCSNVFAPDWADQTFQTVLNTTGKSSRIILAEMGDSPPVNSSVWNSEHALESLAFLMQKYAIDGGSYWRWANQDDADDTDTTLALPVKLRGTNYTYTDMRQEVLDMAGYHLISITNGSFEDGAQPHVPNGWRAAGNGTVRVYLLTQEKGEPEVPTRGTHAMRLVTGPGTDDTVTASSDLIPVQPNVFYTTTSNDRFSWSDDPDPSGAPATRPQVFIKVMYFDTNRKPSAIRAMDTFPYYQEDSTTGFGTFPVQYTTPVDAYYVMLQFGAARNGLPQAITFDVDNVR